MTETQAPPEVLVRDEESKRVLAWNLWDLYLCDDIQNAADHWTPAAFLQMLRDGGVEDVIVLTPPGRYSKEIELKLCVQCHDGRAEVQWSLERDSYSREERRVIVRRMRDFFPSMEGEDIKSKLQISLSLGLHPFI